MDVAYWAITIRIPKPSRGWFRFSLRSYVLLILIIAVIVAILSPEINQRLEARKYHQRTYDLSEFLAQPSPMTDYHRLIQDIKERVASGSWDDAGGMATLVPYPSNLSIVVSQKEEVHSQIADILAAKRNQ